MIEHPRNKLPCLFEDMSKIKHVYNNFGRIRESVKGLSAHSGIDIAAPVGTRIICPAESVIWRPRGRLAIVESNTGWGNQLYLKVTRGAFKYYLIGLCHLHTVEVAKGQIVRQGELLSTVGNTGNSTGPHLHLMMGSNLSWNGYHARSEDAGTAGLCDPFTHFEW